MADEILGTLQATLGHDTKLGDLEGLGQGYPPDIVGDWALGWSHYLLLGDDKVPPDFDPDGSIDIKGVKISAENTVKDLIDALKRER